ncbi:hypothetical protein C8P63_110133 [Melghirimyces profundicolus]|uniref:Uncharacterized protein n=1 Tax=Melghirimyces profundicolus TaxID=1242148 RepID=A0A2T6BV81_9BACL|nr:hypothetical protein [Melghirimyces profundicolus]PTX59988.1 hypothetical protein C8P63_110133 [Melghirimyces profundicolus]
MNRQQWCLCVLSSVLALLLYFPIFVFADGNDAVKPGWKEDKTAKGWIQSQSKIRHMTLEEKISQLFMVYAYGKTPTDPAYEETNLRRKRGGKTLRKYRKVPHGGGSTSTGAAIGREESAFISAHVALGSMYSSKSLY